MTELIQIQPSRRSPHIPRSLDNTALSQYMDCPRRFYYAMVLNRRRSGPPGPAIAFGSAIHKALEIHYKTGGDQAAVERAIIMGWEQHDRPDDHRTVERVFSVYRDYLRQWGDHASESRNWGETVGWKEGNPLVEIPVELGWPGSLHPYTGKIDRIVKWQGLYWVEDHKSTSQMGTYYFHQFDPNNQMLGYAALAEILTGLPIAGVRINAIGVLKTQTKFGRETISYSKERLAEWRANYNRWVERVEESYQVWSHYKNTPDEEYALLEAWPHNFMACSGKYGMCAYTGVCSNQPHLRQRILEQEFEINAWDPMETFGEEAAE